MKYFLILCLISPIYGQDIDSLQLVYKSKMLRIKSTSSSWNPYLGYRRIDEEQFFSIAGYPEEARIIRAKRESGKTTMMVGLLLVIGGGLLVAISGDKESVIQEEGVGFRRPPPPTTVTEEGSKGLKIGGLVGMGLGAILTITGTSKMSSKWAPKERAEDIVAVYNRKLKKQLGLKPNK